MRSADFRRVNVAIRILLQRSIILTKNKTCEDDSSCRRVRSPFKLLMYSRRKARHRQSVTGTPFDLLESLDHQVGIVLGLEPRHVQDIPVGLNAPLSHRTRDPAVAQLPARTQSSSMPRCDAPGSSPESPERPSPSRLAKCR